MRGLFEILGGVLLAGAVLVAAEAAAQQTPQGDHSPDRPVEAKGTGIAGGIMAGAEVVLLVESAIGVEPVWPWIVFPIVGAAGGGVGGYYAEQAEPAGGVALLVGSMALLIPTAVAVSVANAYDPGDEGAVEGGAEGAMSFGLPLDDEGSPGEASTEVEARPDEIPAGGEVPPPEASEPEPEPEPEPETPAPDADDGRSALFGHLSSGALLHVDRRLGAGFGVPAIDLRPTRLDAEQVAQGIPAGIEVHVPLLRIDLP